jgi:hypothetical protein
MLVWQIGSFMSRTMILSTNKKERLDEETTQSTARYYVYIKGF